MSPNLKIKILKRKYRSEMGLLNTLQIGNLPRDIYCDIVETLKDHCAEGSLLELWDYSEEWIAGLSRQQVGTFVASVLSRKTQVFEKLSQTF